MPGGSNHANAREDLGSIIDRLQQARFVEREKLSVDACGDWTAAERHLRWSFERLPAMGEQGQFATVAGLLAEVLYRQDRYEEAEERIELSESASSSGDIDAHVRSRRSKGKLLARRGDLTSAIMVAEEAVSMAHQTDALNLQGDSLLDLGGVLQLASRVDEATAVTTEGLRAYEQKGNLASAARARDPRGDAGARPTRSPKLIDGFSRATGAG